MVKRLLSQSVRGPFHNWKSLRDVNESALSYCLGVSLQHHPAQHLLPQDKVASSICHRRGKTNSKEFTKKFNTYFMSQSEKQILPSPRGCPIKTQSHTQGHTENKPPFSKHLGNMLISESVHLLVRYPGFTIHVLWQDRRTFKWT